jgi:GNAT superfamily N-acetyltransferase
MSQFQIRFAADADLELISWHRARMFSDMGELPPEMFETFRVRSKDNLHRLFEQNEYIGWLATPKEQPDKIVAGAGVLLREVPPRPQSNADGKVNIVSGQQAVIVNVYTDPQWRRRGLAVLLMKEIISWTQQSGIESLILHASDDGRPLYEKLGFIATTEMRFRG